MRPNPTDLAAVFNRAAEVIERNGLYKGGFVAPACVPDRRGQLHVEDLTARPVDVVGAIRIALGYSPEDGSGLDAAAAVRFASDHMGAGDLPPLTNGEPDYVEHLSTWNDAPSRTTLEVTSRLRLWAIDADMASVKAVA